MSNFTLQVVDVLVDTVVCKSMGDDGIIAIDIEGLVTDFKIGDEIQYIEHGFCDVYRDGELIGGISNYYTRLVAI